MQLRPTSGYCFCRQVLVEEQQQHDRGGSNLPHPLAPSNTWMAVEGIAAADAATTSFPQIHFLDDAGLTQRGDSDGGRAVNDPLQCVVTTTAAASHSKTSGSSSVAEFLGSISQDVLEESFYSNENAEGGGNLDRSFSAAFPHSSVSLYPLQPEVVMAPLPPPPPTSAGDAMFRCHLCPFTCMRSIQLRAHMRVHTGEKLHRCPHCPYETDVRCHLHRHLRKHTGERPYKCSVCGKRFFNSDYLVIHTRIHTGEKPFACEFCDYRSTQKSHMKAHVFNKHSGRRATQ